VARPVVQRKRKHLNAATMDKNVGAFITGRSSSEGKKMGQAEAIVSVGRSTHQSVSV